LPTERTGLPFVTSFLLEMADTALHFLVVGLLFALAVGTFLDMRPALALACGLTWGFLMWAFVGGLLATSFAWRPSATILVASRQKFAPAIDRACERFRLRVMDDTPDRVVLGPKRVRHVLVVPARLRVRLR
jgi:hypothetical protein